MNQRSGSGCYGRIQMMVALQAIISLTPWLWLSQAIGFSPEPTVLSPWSGASTAFILRHEVFDSSRRRRSKQLVILQESSQSVNDNNGGFHYDQEPRASSFISEMCKQDLWERRQTRRPLRSRQAAHSRRRAPNSRGAFPAQQPHYPNPITMDANPIIDVEGPPPPRGGGGGGGGGDEYNEFQGTVSANLKSMTDLLKEMQRSQSTQSTDVQMLTLKVADMADRLSRTEKMKNRMMNENRGPDSMMDDVDRNFGTPLDGEFHQKIKDVIDEFDMVDRRGYDAGDGDGGEYYLEKIAQLEAKINMINEGLQETEEKFNTQMEYVDLLVTQRLDDIDEAASFDGGMQFQQPGPPPGGERYMEDQPPRPPPPPPLQELPPPPPPPPGYDNNPYNNIDDDDGRTFYQERNYNVPNVPPPQPRVVQEISSSQQKGAQKNSVNTRSGGHHYNERNNSFISAFSKADNEHRRQFDPFRDPGRQRSVNQVQQGEQLPRGVRAPPNRRGFSSSFSGMPNNMEPMGMPPPMSMEPMGMPEYPGYFEEPYNMYEDGGPMMMEEEFFYDGMNDYF